MAYVPCPECLTIRRFGHPHCLGCGGACAYAGEQHGAVRSRPLRRLPTYALLSCAWLLLACGVGGDPQRRAKYEADKASCQKMTDSMVAAARARGGDVDEDAYEPARVSCMDYRGWRNGKFNRASIPAGQAR
jgi:hypothetical protein